MMKWKWTRRNFDNRKWHGRKGGKVKTALCLRTPPSDAIKQSNSPVDAARFFPSRASVKESRQNLFANSIRKRHQSAEARGGFLFWRLHERYVDVSIRQDEDVGAGLLHWPLQSHLVSQSRPDATVHDESVGKLTREKCFFLVVVSLSHDALRHLFPFDVAHLAFA